MAAVGQKRSLEPIRDARTGAQKGFQIVQSKKHKTDHNAVIASGTSALIEAQGMKRTSGLMAPTMQLSGHRGHIYSCKFNPAGTYLASCSADQTISFWEVYGECKNFASVKGHSADVLDLCWSRDGEHVFTASADKNGGMFDVEMGQRVKRFRGHTGVVNSVCAARRGDPLLITGSDDCSALLWDTRFRNATQTLKHDYQITSVAFSDDSTQVFCGGIDNEIHCWDLRANKIVYALEGHEDTVTGLKLSPDGNFLLSNGMDSTLHCWDVRPYVSETRLANTYRGHQHDFQQNLLKCSWSADGQRISAGSSDRFVYVWDVTTKSILYKLPGHNAAVSEVDFHPNEPVIVSCGADKTIFLGEIE
jgi:Prp8 binding protein